MFFVIATLLILAAILYLNLLKYRVKQVVLHDRNLSIIKRNSLGSQHNETHLLNEIDFTYRTGVKKIKFRRSWNSTDDIGDILTIFYKDEVWFDLVPDDYDWPNEKIRHIAMFLKQAGVKRVIEKFSDNEVLLED